MAQATNQRLGTSVSLGRLTVNHRKAHLRDSLAKTRQASQASNSVEKSEAFRKPSARKNPYELYFSLERARLISQAASSKTPEFDDYAVSRRDPSELHRSLQRARLISHKSHQKKSRVAGKKAANRLGRRV